MDGIVGGRRMPFYLQQVSWPDAGSRVGWDPVDLQSAAKFRLNRARRFMN